MSWTFATAFPPKPAIWVCSIRNFPDIASAAKAAANWLAVNAENGQIVAVKLLELED